MKSKIKKIKKTSIKKRVNRKLNRSGKISKINNGEKAQKKEKKDDAVKIKIIGVGGAGGNAVTRMNEDFPRVIESVVINTDIQDLECCAARKKIYIGKNLTRGLGAGMNPEIGRQAAEENQSEIAEALDGVDMVFLTAGFGGGTGTGALPVVAQIAKEMGILTIAVITKPFSFEGYERQRIAEEGISKIRDKVDTLIVVPNDRIFSVINKNTTMAKAFDEIDEVLKNSVIGIAEVIASPGIINIDFADIKAIIQNAGSAVIGIGSSCGAERAISAANSAVNSPLLELSIDGAKRVLFSVSGSRDLKMNEVNEIAKMISERAHSSAKIIFGAYSGRKLKKGEIKITLIASDFNGEIRKDSKNLSLPNLFVIDGVEKKNENIQKETALDFSVKPKQQDVRKEEFANKEDIWDIPTFLRKKKK
ncbi:cell division protein FtsZ [Candidatus Wolfebacteria bacterium]|nr:cell division protein FtsZ [Candidatus Wolfebacteria bacterium]